VIVGTVMMAATGATGCHADDDPEVRADAGSAPTAEDDAAAYRGNISVLESPEHGPQLCTAMAESYPPQCGGPDVVGWSWDAADGEEPRRGTTWGAYELTGTWDGGRFTLTEPPAPARPVDWPQPDLSSPCPAPDGGWVVVDPATTDRSTLDAAGAAAQARPDFAGLWVDQSINPASAEPIEGVADELAMNDPTKLVLDVRVTGDVDAAERDLRAVWGGALCVSPAAKTLVELSAIQTEIGDDLASTGVLQGTGIDQYHGVVDVDVYVDVYVDDGLQAELDDRYGPDVVAVTALLQPVG
jgi:hypothetical protein